MCHLCWHNTILYLKIECLDGLPILVVGELAKRRPLLLQVFIKPLERARMRQELLLDRHPATESASLRAHRPLPPGGCRGPEHWKQAAVGSVTDKSLHSLGLFFPP